MKATSARTALVLLTFIGSALSSTVQVYIYPTPQQSLLNDLELTQKEARLVMAQHVGLEKFEHLAEPLADNADAWGGLGSWQFGAENFVGAGIPNAVVVGVSESFARDVLPPALSLPTFKYTKSESPDSQVNMLLNTFVGRAAKVYSYATSSPSLSSLPSSQLVDKPQRLLDIFSLPATASSSAFIADLSSLVDFLDSVELDQDLFDAEKFGAFQFGSLQRLAKHYGRDSEEYKTATATLRAALSSAIAQHKLNLIVLTVPETEFASSTHNHHKRQPPQSPLPPHLPHPAAPISAISTCFATEETCSNSTSFCSGHGACVSASKAGRTCFVCTCENTKVNDGKKTIRWAGDACEKQDISDSFTLLAGTVIALILLIGGSVALLAGIGGEELPSTLTGGVAPGASKRD